MLTIYEMVFKPKASNAMGATAWGFQLQKDEHGTPLLDKNGDQFYMFKENFMRGPAVYEAASIPLLSALVSIAIGFALAAKNGQLGMIFTKEHAKMCLLFQPAAVGFGISQFMGFFNLDFLTPDTLKVFDQSRLLVTALVMLLLLGKRYSRATWISLVVITLAAVMYGQVKSLDAGSGGAADKNVPVGALLVLLNAFVTALAGVWAEKFMKAYKSVPFYIQKIYLELGNVVTQLIMIFAILPAIKPGITNVKNLGFNIFHGWGSNPYVIILFFVFFVKSYLQGILVKRMSSLVKQLSQVVATALVYFFAIMHTVNCDVKFQKDVLGKAAFDNWNGKTGTSPQWVSGAMDSYGARDNWLNASGKGVTPASIKSHANQFFCFQSPVKGVMVLADVLVLITVVAYIFANRDKARKTMYRKERDDLLATAVKTV
jgi:drug/metabolite transporter (DMT)-like permease